MSSTDIFSLFLVTVTIFASCGESHDAAALEEQGVNHELVLLDSIGIEFGDSNYVFGMPRAVEFTSRGNVVVGDISSMKLMMYSPDGTFICSGGSEGQGPGEYTAPSGISSTPSGGIAVSDAMSGKIIFYDSSLDYSHELTGFTPQPPGVPEILDDGSIVGTRFGFDRESGKLTNTLSLWKPEETEASFDYLERSSSFDQQNPMKVYQEIGINFCVLEDGRVIVSPLSADEYSLTCYNTENGMDWEIHPTYEKKRRSEEDLEIEREMMRNAMRRNGQDASYADQLELQEWANAVTGLYAQKDKIWVRRGNNLLPLFDVYSTDGEFLYSCSVPNMPFGSNIAFTISPYSSVILAFLANPEDYPKIWLLQEVD